MKVYIVEYWDYDDVRVGPVFSTREKAQVWADKQNQKARDNAKKHKLWATHDHYEVEEYEVDVDETDNS